MSEDYRLMCEQCQQPVDLRITFGMIGEMYFRCKNCEALFICHKLTDMWEQGLENGKASIRSQIRDILGIKS